MTTPVLLCPRLEPGMLFGSPFDAARQQRLVAYGTHGRAVAEPVLLQHEAGRVHLPADSAGQSILCIGDGAKPMLLELAREASKALARSTYTDDVHWPRYGTLVLLAPELPADTFAASADAYSVPALALRCVSRVMVLYCPHDATADGTLARQGPAAGVHNRVSGIDLTPWIEYRDDCAYGALCACESLGLIVRLLQGTTLDAALPPRSPRPSAA